MTNDPKVEEWIETFSSHSTKQTYRSSFKRFEQFTGKTGTEMIAEQRKLLQNPDTADTYNRKVFAYYERLLESKAKLTGGVKGRAGGTTGRLKEKTLSQLTAKHAVTVVQSFFAFYNVPISLRKFNRKDVRMQRPRVERKKHQLTSPEIRRLFNVADLRDKCVLALGLIGQDESTVAGLKTTDFTGKLDAVRLEFAEIVRPKTNSEILLVLTPEIQAMLKTYIATVKGPWLFEGHNNKQIENGQPNKIFRALCSKAGLMDNGKRLSFHCCRLWFSAQLRNKISDDLIDLMTGHVLRYNGAYIPEEHDQLRKLLTDAGIIDLLNLQGTLAREKEIDELKYKLAELSKMVYLLAGKSEIRDDVSKYLSDEDRKRLEKVVREQDEV